MREENTCEYSFNDIWEDDERFLSYVCDNLKTPSFSLGYDEERGSKYEFEGPIPPYLVPRDFKTKKKRLRVIEEEKKLFEYYKDNNKCVIGDYFARKENQTAGVNRLRQIDRAKKLREEWEEKKDVTNKQVEEYIDFCNKKERLPKQTSEEAAEKRLAFFYGNLRKRIENTEEFGDSLNKEKNDFFAECMNRMEKVANCWKTRKSKTSSALFDELRLFVKNHEKWPSQTTDNLDEKRLAGSLSRIDVNELSPKETEEYEKLKTAYGRNYSRYKEMKPEHLLDELKKFIKKTGRYPHNRKDEKNKVIQNSFYTWHEERKLAHAIEHNLNNSYFTQEQKDDIESIKEEYRSSGKTSYSEKLLFCALKKVLDVGTISIFPNDRRFGPEVDILLECDNRHIAIQYDGGAHNRPNRRDLDEDFTQKLIENGNLSKILRIRENNLPEFNLGGLEDDNKIVKILKIEQSYQSLSDERKNEILNEILEQLGIPSRDTKLLQWDEIKAAAYKCSTTSFTVNKLVGELIYIMLTEGNNAPKDDTFINNIKNLRGYEKRGSLRREHREVLNVVRHNFAPEIRTGKDIL